MRPLNKQVLGYKARPSFLSRFYRIGFIPQIEIQEQIQGFDWQWQPTKNALSTRMNYKEKRIQSLDMLKMRMNGINKGTKISSRGLTHCLSHW